MKTMEKSRRGERVHFVSPIWGIVYRDAKDGSWTDVRVRLGSGLVRMVRVPSSLIESDGLLPFDEEEER